MSSAKVIITGANGYIGRRVAATLQERGMSIEAWTRSQPESGIAWRRYALADADLPEIEAGSTIIHLAADTSGASDVDLEKRAAIRLADLAKASVARIIFASSQTALSPGSAYGRAKKEIEAIVADAGGVSVRLGLVYGRRRLGGVFKTLVEAMQRLPFTPAILPAPGIQPIHVDDVAEGFARIVERKTLAGAFNLAGEPVPFHRFLAEIAYRRHDRSPLLLPLPRLLLDPVLAIAPAAIRERTRSLMNLTPMPVAETLEALALSLRPWPLWLGPSVAPLRRDLVREGRALLAYVGGAKPGSELVRRYVRALEALGQESPLGVPGFARRHPWMLSLLERPSHRGRSAFEERLDWALSLAEATPEGAQRFDRPPRGMLSATFTAGAAGFGEALRRLFGAPARALGAGSWHRRPH